MSSDRGREPFEHVEQETLPLPRRFLHHYWTFLLLVCRIIEHCRISASTPLAERAPRSLGCIRTVSATLSVKEEMMRAVPLAANTYILKST